MSFGTSLNAWSPGQKMAVPAAVLAAWKMHFVSGLQCACKPCGAQWMAFAVPMLTPWSLGSTESRVGKIYNKMSDWFGGPTNLLFGSGLWSDSGLNMVYFWRFPEAFVHLDSIFLQKTVKTEAIKW